jgi:DNA-binding PadR family transcriptional regulator
MRHLFLALLAARPAHGYELGSALEHRFGSLLPSLNAGQIYTTLARLERDGLVRGTDVAGDSRGKRVYDLTTAGRDVLATWLNEPIPGARLRDEFFMKLVLASGAGLVSAKALIDRQRREYLQSLRDLGVHAGTNDPVAALLVEGAALHLEADLRWLDLCEARLVEQEDGNGSGG